MFPSTLTASPRDKSIRAAAGEALGDTVQAPCFSGRTGGFPPCILGSVEDRGGHRQQHGNSRGWNSKEP